MQRRRAVVTGGASGIGAACARRLAADDVAVVVLDLPHQQQAGTALAAEIGGEFAAVDVTEAAAVRTTFAAMDPVDILVTCAGVTRPGRAVDETSEEDWHTQVAVNLTGTFLCIRAVVPGMRERRWGRIVTISSALARRGIPGSAAYAAAKAGVEGLTRAAAADLAPFGITVNAVAPGYVDTPMVRQLPADTLHRRVADIGSGRLATPDEIAAVVGFLASEAASYVTGAVIDVNGGFRIGC